ncbi:HIT domain-containing protein [Nocardia sp. NPDC050435]|uniref:HIT family protein n=1 Tax=Nocardia sp. NPDC050435 TaxID=3155040 RepID=UPI0033D4C022
MDNEFDRPPASDSTACLFCRPDDPTQNRVLARRGSMYARWDNFPAARGHVEIVPLRHVESYFELTADEAADLHYLACQVKARLDTELRPDGYTIGINDGSAAGQTIAHVHLHLIPRWHGDVADPRGGIRQILPGCDPDAWAGHSSAP